MQHNCNFCEYSSKYKHNVTRHEKSVHGQNKTQESRSQKKINGTSLRSKRPVIIPANGGFDLGQMNTFDIRLKKNFKIFISGPSGSGKTYFITDLLRNLDIFATDPPKLIIYVYRVWQPKYEEMPVDYFIEDGVDLMEKIRSYARDQHTLIVFDDLIYSESIPTISRLFTVEGRHNNMSLIFVTQKMFVNDEKFREISGNSDYFLVFKNPRNAREIRTLASQMTPGKMDLVNYYEKATEKPFTYLFINLTQQCQEQVRFLSHLFDKPHVVRTYYNSTFLSLHDSHQEKRTNYSKMFMTNEIVEDCDCSSRDMIKEKNIPSASQESNITSNDLVENDRMEIGMENGDVLRNNFYTEDISSKDSYVDNQNGSLNGINTKEFHYNGKKQRDLKVGPIKLKRLYQVKTATPERLILTKQFEIKSKGEKPNNRSLLTTADEQSTIKNNLGINKFGGSFSSETWNTLKDKESQDKNMKKSGANEIDEYRFNDQEELLQVEDDISANGTTERNLMVERLREDDGNEINEARFVDLGESMQEGDDSPKPYIPNVKTDKDVNQAIDGNYPITAYSQMLPDDDEEMEEAPYKAIEYQLYDSLQCPICEENFVSKAAFNKHKSDCTVTSYACTKCGVNFMSRSGLKSHFNAIHSERKIIKDKVKKLAAKNRK